MSDIFDEAIELTKEAVEEQIKRYPIHKFAGLDGVRCGLRDSVPVSLSWDSVTCPGCLKLKKDWEPWSTTIDTRGD